MHIEIDNEELEQQKMAARIKEVDFKRQKLLERLPSFKFLIRSKQVKTKEFIIKKIASILYECLVCKEPRDLIDWIIAENFVNQKFDIELINSCAQKILVYSAYFDANGVVEKDYDYVLFCLGQYPNHLISRLLIKASHSYSYELFDQFVGEMIRTLGWEEGLRRMYPFPPYAGMKFY